MGLELIIFIAALLFGIFLYWRESNGNGVYRFVNKMVNSKELQMAPDSKKGFIYQQALLPRLIFVVTLVLVAALIVEFLTPISVFGSYNGISAFASFAAGTLLGTYLANIVLKSSKVIEEQSESLEDKFENVVEKGKDFIEDLKTKDAKVVEEAKKEIKTEPTSKADEKSARDRLKDKGLM
jgi:Na+/H+ antiporter NhaC